MALVARSIVGGSRVRCEADCVGLAQEHGRPMTDPLDIPTACDEGNGVSSRARVVTRWRVRAVWVAVVAAACTAHASRAGCLLFSTDRKATTTSSSQRLGRPRGIGPTTQTLQGLVQCRVPIRASICTDAHAHRDVSAAKAAGRSPSAFSGSALRIPLRTLCQVWAIGAGEHRGNG